MKNDKTANFANDPKMRLNEQTGKWSYVGDDGVSYEYDENVGAWFPMYDEKLIQQQSSVYAVEGVEEVVIPKPKEKKKRAATYDVDPNAPEQQQQQKKPKRELPNTSVYVTGIPPDVTMEELKTTFTKCGVIMEDLETGEPKIKIYRDDQGVPKGDALITYFKEESVPLAIDLLDEAELRPGEKTSKLNVQKAVFKQKDNTTTEQKKKSMSSKMKAKKKLQQMQRKLDWVESDVGKKQEKFAKIVILKNMYTQEELDAEPTLYLELKQDVREECEKLGEITNVILYDKSPGGIISVRYKEKESADACIAVSIWNFLVKKRTYTFGFNSLGLHAIVDERKIFWRQTNRSRSI
ncbi:hypothetical protein BDF20DRAFT_812538 [Mycotypha africana]|uniref:uncharacterized protein n=1 Tax=Mycotypha africana TaxID=64632 RepID=UPI002300F4B9|nr:uncharacterized protein BDF20DRAFT_812538 [Mycotypha africana]KAI8990798.1 hypothetical protein BDF20DRAFT_812538 [Mycotypha africana]